MQSESKVPDAACGLDLLCFNTIYIYCHLVRPQPVLPPLGINTAGKPQELLRIQFEKSIIFNILSFLPYF